MSKQGTYGFPCVTDPNDFDPDRECCSPAEIATWEEAKRTYGKPDHKPNVGCHTEFSEDGALVKHVLSTSWGIGVNLINTCDGCQTPQWEEPMLTCHECGGPEFCAECWIEHEKRHDNGEL